MTPSAFGLPPHDELERLMELTYELNNVDPADYDSQEALSDRLALGIATFIAAADKIKDVDDSKYQELTHAIRELTDTLKEEPREKVWKKVALRVGIVAGVAGITGTSLAIYLNRDKIGEGKDAVVDGLQEKTKHLDAVVIEEALAPPKSSARSRIEWRNIAAGESIRLAPSPITKGPIVALMQDSILLSNSKGVVWDGRVQKTQANYGVTINHFRVSIVIVASFCELTSINRSKYALVPINDKKRIAQALNDLVSSMIKKKFFESSVSNPENKFVCMTFHFPVEGDALSHWHRYCCFNEKQEDVERYRLFERTVWGP